MAVKVRGSVLQFPFCCCDKTLWQKSHLHYEGIYLASTSRSQSVPEETPGQGLKAGTWDRKREEGCLLAHSVSGSHRDDFFL